MVVSRYDFEHRSPLIHSLTRYAKVDEIALFLASGVLAVVIRFADYCMEGWLTAPPGIH
jgi:hypothetical protein